MRHERPFSGHNIAYEIDADYLDGAACDCPMCRPHGSLVAFLSRDHLTLTDSHRSHRFNRLRLSHRFCATEPAKISHIGGSPAGTGLFLTRI